MALYFSKEETRYAAKDGGSRFFLCVVFIEAAVTKRAGMTYVHSCPFFVFS